MSKADEFEALLTAANQVKREIVIFGDEGTSEELASKAEDDFLVWIDENRALIARALRYAEMIESPSNDLRIEITNAVMNRAIYDLEDKLYHTPKLGDAALSVLREAAK